MCGLFLFFCCEFLFSSSSWFRINFCYIIQNCNKLLEVFVCFEIKNEIFWTIGSCVCMRVLWHFSIQFDSNELKKLKIKQTRKNKKEKKKRNEKSKSFFEQRQRINYLYLLIFCVFLKKKRRRRKHNENEGGKKLYLNLINSVSRWHLTLYFAFKLSQLIIININKKNLYFHIFGKFRES